MLRMTSIPFLAIICPISCTGFNAPPTDFEVRYFNCFIGVNIAALLVLSVPCLWVIIRYKLKEKGRNARYLELKYEYDRLIEFKNNQQVLCKMLSTGEAYGNSYSKMLDIIEVRIKALSAFFEHDMPDSLSKKVEDCMTSQLLDERTRLLDSIGLLYALYYPSFVYRLSEHNLTATEIGYCCLLIMGLKTTEMSSVVHISNIYNVNSRLRQKLGLKSDGLHLNEWLKSLFEETESYQVGA